MLYSSDLIIDRLFSWLDLLVGTVLPFITLIIFNLMLLYQIKKANKILKTIRSNNPVLHVRHDQSRQGNENQLSQIMLLVSFAFLALTLPKRIIGLIWRRNLIVPTVQNLAHYTLLQSISLQMGFANCSVNFWFYLAMGKQFRNEVRQMILRGCGECLMGIRKCKKKLRDTSNDQETKEMGSSKL